MVDIPLLHTGLNFAYKLKLKTICVLLRLSFALNKIGGLQDKVS